MAIARRVVLTLLALSLAACSSKPSDAEALRLFNEEQKGFNSLGLFDVENVQRVNGYEKDAQHYVVEMQFDLITKTEFQEAVEKLTPKTGDDFTVRNERSAIIDFLKREFGTFKKGQRFTKKKPIVLQRTEAGWALASS